MAHRINTVRENYSKVFHCFEQTRSVQPIDSIPVNMTSLKSMESASPQSVGLKQHGATVSKLCLVQCHLDTRGGDVGKLVSRFQGLWKGLVIVDCAGLSVSGHHHLSSKVKSSLHENLTVLSKGYSESHSSLHCMQDPSVTNRRVLYPLPFEPWDGNHVDRGLFCWWLCAI